MRSRRPRPTTPGGPSSPSCIDLAGVEDVGGAPRDACWPTCRPIRALARLAPLLNSVLPLELPDNELTAQLTGEVRADNTRQLLVQLLQAAATGPRAAAASPLLLVLDDAHWFDSASWALARQVVARVRPLLLVLATRPLVEPLPGRLPAPPRRTRPPNACSWSR